MNNDVIVKVKLDRHYGMDIVCLSFRYDRDVVEHIKKFQGSRWSPSKKCWYVPYDKEITRKLSDHFKNQYSLEFSPFEKRHSGDIEFIKRTTLIPAGPHDHELIDQLKKWMEHKRYSQSTIKTYCSAILIFIRFIKPKTAQEVTDKDVVRFTTDYILKYGLSASYQNQAINAIKLFYREVLDSELDVELIERPRRGRHLPNVLSKEEVKAILQAPLNLKHRAMLSLIYACGLRRSELLNLHPSDVNSMRGLLVIKNAKGKKDRVVPLSNKVLTLLRDYYLAFKPKTWLFEGQKKGAPYTAASLQEVFKSAVKRARINKKASLHWLRHSYATHLLESGTDLRYIQEILGHKSSRTTEVYTHVSNKNIQQIKSPFDDL